MAKKNTSKGAAKAVPAKKSAKTEPKKAEKKVAEKAKTPTETKAEKTVKVSKATPIGKVKAEVADPTKSVEKAADHKVVAKQIAKSSDIVEATPLPAVTKQEILLTIAIPTIEGRESDCQLLIDTLELQRAGNSLVEIITEKDNKEISIGAKRQKLYEAAKGLYTIQVDDDDLLSNDAIELILEAIKEDKDCITFKEFCVINGEVKHGNFSLKYDKWADNEDGFDHVRTPFYKCAIKTDIAKAVGVEDLRYGEDQVQADKLKLILESETHIDKFIYHYRHVSSAHNERYGIEQKVVKPSRAPRKWVKR